MCEVYSRYPFGVSDIPWERVYGHSVDSQNTTIKEEIEVNMQEEEKTFTTLEIKKTDKKNFFNSIQENNTLDSWTHVHPLNWTKREVLDWVYSYGIKIEDDHMTFCGAAFGDYSGEQLCQMTAEDFVNLEPNHGKDLHRLLQDLKGDLVQPNFDNKETYSYIPATVSEIEPAYLQSELYVSNLIENDCFLQGDDSAIDVTKAFIQDEGYDSSSDTERKLSNSSTISDQSLHICEDSYHEEARRPYTHAPGQHNLGSDGEESDPEYNTVNSHRKRDGAPKRGIKLWEFMRDMLRDRRNEHLIKWEDKPNGIFRILKSEEMARLWGLKKNNDNMTYEKLSRAIRFCRKVGYFAEIPKNRGYPKKLIFKFGHKAQGYK